MKIKQTAGRDSLGNFAPEFAKINDDILFGEVECNGVNTSNEWLEPVTDEQYFALK